jgi:hypothetical protein
VLEDVLGEDCVSAVVDGSTVDSAVVDHVSRLELAELNGMMEEGSGDGLQGPA